MTRHQSLLADSDFRFLYCAASFLPALRAEMMRQLAAPVSVSRHV
jgi:hypothetical protein